MGEEETHFIKSCMGDMFDVAFTRAIYSHTYNRQKGGSFSHLVCFSFSRNMFSRTPTLLLGQSLLSRRQIISKKT